MKHFTKSDFDELEKITRTNLINSISGYKSANLIGTISNSGATNLAIFSSVVHIGANPPLLGFVMRPVEEVPRHTYENIKENEVFTINHVRDSFVENAHFTSAKFDKNVSEFAACGLTEQFHEDFAAPFVAESRIKIGLKLADEIPVNINKTILIIGEIEHLFLPENALLEDGNVNLNSAETACISGLDGYHEVGEAVRFPFAKVSKMPEFKIIIL
ncbi:MAG: flavin reductase [Pyrinomonadaceae bacterium]|nr:flavin reductase [Pyrinomonadaceae bacterium]